MAETRKVATTQTAQATKAGDIMTRPVVAAKAHASARDIALQLLNGLYSGMPVTDDEGRVIGIVTELDLLNAVQKGKELVRLTAADVMHKEVVTADVETPISEIVKIMAERNIIRLPVTAEGRLVGVVARCDVLRNYIQPEFVTYF